MSRGAILGALALGLAVGAPASPADAALTAVARTAKFVTI